MKMRLLADGWFTLPKLSSGTVLVPRQVLRIYGHTKRASLPDGLAELADPMLEGDRAVMVNPEEAYALTAAMEEQWKTQGIFPYDLAQTPEPYDAIKLPLSGQDSDGPHPLAVPDAGGPDSPLRTLQR